MAAINKVVYGGNTLIDLTEDTVTPATLADGATAHNAAGELIAGTMQAKEDLDTEIAAQEDLIASIKAKLASKLGN